MSLSKTVLPSPERAKSWLLRLVAVLVLWVGVSFVADLFLIACFPLNSGFLQKLLNGGLSMLVTPLSPAAGLIVLNLGVFFCIGWRWRSGGRHVWLGLGTAGVLTADLILLACYPHILDPLIDATTNGRSGEIAMFAGVIGLIPLGVLASLWWLRSWRWITVSYLALGMILFYLAKDDATVIHPATIEQIPPAPGDEAGFGFLMRYGRNHPLGRDFKAPNRIFQPGNEPYVDSSKPTEWAVWLVHHQAGVEADWADLSPVRAWMEELDGFKTIGDLTPPKYDSEIIAFAPFRSYAQHACAIAGLQAITGHGDEAIETLLPLLRVSRRMEPSSRTLVRTMIGRVMQKQAVGTVNFVLDKTPVSKATRARLVEALSIGTRGEAGIRHLLAIEDAYMFARSENSLSELIFPPGAPNRTLLNVVSPFIYNRRRTLNFYVEYMAELQALAARRDADGLHRKELAFYSDRSGPKNYMGHYIVHTLVPAYSYIVQSYWALEDANDVLLARLAKS